MLQSFVQTLRRWGEAPAARGQGLVEYALVLVLVAVVVIAILTVLGPQIGNVFSHVNCALGDGKIKQDQGNQNSPTKCKSGYDPSIQYEVLASERAKLLARPVMAYALQL